MAVVEFVGGPMDGEVREIQHDAHEIMVRMMPDYRGIVSARSILVEPPEIKTGMYQRWSLAGRRIFWRGEI